MSRVLWRFRRLVAFGFCLAFMLAFLALVRVNPVGSPVFSFRKAETWISSAQLFVTEPGFPWGRRAVTTSDDGEQSDPSRFTGLAILYARLADSDPVIAIARRDGPFKTKILASPVVTGPDNDTLPIIQVSATGTSPRNAVVNSRRASDALVAFIRSRQEANSIPVNQRVLLQTIATPRKATLLSGRPIVVPIIIFFGLMALVIGLALLLENLRPVAAGAPAEEPARLRLPA